MDTEAVIVTEVEIAEKLVTVAATDPEPSAKVAVRVE
jgi:hypothetical protein